MEELLDLVISIVTFVMVRATVLAPIVVILVTITCFFSLHDGVFNSQRYKYKGITPRRELLLKLFILNAPLLFLALVDMPIMRAAVSGGNDGHMFLLTYVMLCPLLVLMWSWKTLKLCLIETKWLPRPPPDPKQAAALEAEAAAQKLVRDELNAKLRVKNEAIAVFLKGVETLTAFREELVYHFSRYYDEHHQSREIDAENLAYNTFEVLSALPRIYVPDPNGVMLIKAMEPQLADYKSILFYRISALSEFGNILQTILVSPKLPEGLRTEHHQIVAGSGQGKTTLFKSMIVEDLKKKDVCIIVIDSQDALLPTLADRVDPDRLLLLNPGLYSPALNLFATIGEGEAAQGNALSMLSYIFSSKDIEFTGPQEMMYQNMSRLCMAIPGANMVTLRDLFEPMATATPEYQRIIDTLDDNTRSFFKGYHQPNNGRFAPSRDAIHTRLLTALNSKVFRDMVGAKTMKLDFLKEIELGKVILVNTDKSLMQGDGAMLFGRIVAGLVMQAVRSRPELTGKTVYLYIDEFIDYASDGTLLLEMFRQGRKRNLGMIVTLLGLGDLSAKLRSVMSQSTTIKMAGGQYLAAEELPAVAKQLDIEPDELRKVGKGTFVAHVRGYGTVPWAVKEGVLEALPVNKPHVMDALRERMRREYGDDLVVPPKKEPPEEFKEAF